jgi:hypothetical protein
MSSSTVFSRHTDFFLDKRGRYDTIMPIFVPYVEQHIERGDPIMKIDKVMTGKRDGEVRCLACFARFWPKMGTDRATCPKCGMEWRISWPFPRTAKVRGPVWEKYPKPDSDKT